MIFERALDDDVGLVESVVGRGFVAEAQIDAAIAGNVVPQLRRAAGQRVERVDDRRQRA